MGQHVSGLLSLFSLFGSALAWLLDGALLLVYVVVTDAPGGTVLMRLLLAPISSLFHLCGLLGLLALLSLELPYHSSPYKKELSILGPIE